MSEKFKNRFRIPSTRMQNWDYGWNATYFITICTSDRYNYFGKISDGRMNINDIGQMAQQFWMEIPLHFPFVMLDAFVVMPNHIHGIISISKQKQKSIIVDDTCAPSFLSIDTLSTIPSNKLTLGQKRLRNQHRETVSSILGSYKSIVTRNAHKLNLNFGWQPRFYDNLVRTDDAFDTISNYIKTNPERWNKDKFFK